MGDSLCKLCVYYSIILYRVARVSLQSWLQSRWFICSCLCIYMTQFAWNKKARVVSYGKPKYRPPFRQSLLVLTLEMMHRSQFGSNAHRTSSTTILLPDKTRNWPYQVRLVRLGWGDSRWVVMRLLIYYSIILHTASPKYLYRGCCKADGSSAVAFVYIWNNDNQSHVDRTRSHGSKGIACPSTAPPFSGRA